MTTDLDTKISFASGSFLTIIMAAPLYEMWLALTLGFIGGFGGVLGKHLFYTIKDLFTKRKGSR